MHRFGERDIGRHVDEQLGLEEGTCRELYTSIGFGSCLDFAKEFVFSQLEGSIFDSALEGVRCD
jgi:hypothetical protein